MTRAALRWLLALAALMAVLSGLQLNAAFGHGPAPAALGLHGADDAPTTWIRTNIGLASGRPGGAFGYVCPAMWGSEDRFPPVARLPDGRAVVVHDAMAYIIAADGCGRAIEPLPDAGSTVAAVAFDDAVFVATREAGSSTLWRIDGVSAPVAIDHFDVVLDSVVVSDSQLLLAAARPHAEVRVWGADAEPDRPDWDASFIALRGAGRFARLSTDAGVVLMEATGDGWRQIARAFTSIHGPVRLGAGWLMTVDGVIHQRAGDDGDFSPVRETSWTCLQRVGPRVFACVDFGLSEVADDLTLTPVFALDDLIGIDCPDAEAHAICDGQWLHFGAEAGLVRGPVEPDAVPQPEPPAPARADDDCAQAPASPTTPADGGAAVLLLALALRRRIAKLRPTACLNSPPDSSV